MAKMCMRFDDLGSDGSSKRLGILGGTFDPIHIGHLRIAEEVRDALGLDVVLFMPTGNPVFKRDQDVTAAETRYERVCWAVADNPYFDVSRLEIDRGGDTYTIDTLRELRLHYPDNVEFFFIVGADAAETIGKWRGCREIAELTRLAVASGRPGFAQADDLRQKILAAGPFEVDLVQVSALEVSSSDIRQHLAEGRSVRYLVPDAVLADIARQPAKSGLLESAEESVGRQQGVDPLSKKFLKARKAELGKRVSPKRYKHSLGVSKACVQLAETYGVDRKKARLAGMLHDWDKGFDDEQARARVRELGMEGEVDPYVVEHMPMVLHGVTAARALGASFPEIPSDVLQAIERHTTAAIDMTPLDMVLYIADAIEPSRQYGRIDELRAAVGAVSLEELYFQTYEYWTFLLIERGKPLHPDTIRIWNHYAIRRGNERKRSI